MSLRRQVSKGEFIMKRTEHGKQETVTDVNNLPTTNIGGKDGDRKFEETDNKKKPRNRRKPNGNGQSGRDNRFGNRNGGKGPFKDSNYNDDSDFDKFGQVENAGKHTFAYKLGQIFNLTGAPSASSSSSFAQAGIMTIDLVNTPGVTNPNSALQSLTRKLHTQLYSEQTAASNVQPADVFMYCLAFDEPVSCYAEWCRIFGILQNYSPVNGYTPSYLITALGYDFNDLDAKKSELYTFLEHCANEIESWVIPTDVTMYKRHMTYFSKIFTDANGTRAKMYAFRKSVYRTWSDTASDQGSMLTTKAMHSGSLLDLAAMKAIWNDIIGNLQQSETVTFISTLLGKAIGPLNGYKLAIPAWNYQTDITHDERILDQIHNMVIATEFRFQNIQDGYNIEQDITKNYLVFNPSMKVMAMTSGFQQQFAQMYTQDRIIDTHMEAPNSKEVVHMTVFQPTFYTQGSGDEQEIFLDTVTTDLAVNALIWVFILQPNDLTQKSFTSYQIGYAMQTHTGAASVLQDFEHHPAVWMFGAAGTIIRLFNLDNPSLFSKAQLDVMNEIRNYSIMSIDINGRKMKRDKQ